MVAVSRMQFLVKRWRSSLNSYRRPAWSSSSPTPMITFISTPCNHFHGFKDPVKVEKIEETGQKVWGKGGKSWGDDCRIINLYNLQEQWNSNRFLRSPKFTGRKHCEGASCDRREIFASAESFPIETKVIDWDVVFLPNIYLTLKYNICPPSLTISWLNLTQCNSQQILKDWEFDDGLWCSTFSFLLKTDITNCQLGR